MNKPDWNQGYSDPRIPMEIPDVHMKIINKIFDEMGIDVVIMKGSIGRSTYQRIAAARKHGGEPAGMMDTHFTEIHEFNLGNFSISLALLRRDVSNQSYEVRIFEYDNHETSN